MARTDETASSRTRELDRVMGGRGSITIVGLDGPDAERLLTVAEWRLRELEARWSRFLPDSEITELGAAAGRAVHVSEPTRTLVRRLVEAWEATSGAFDPTRLPDLVAAGYAASVLDATVTTVLPPAVISGFDPGQILIDDDEGTVTLPRGGTLDPGGLGKGLAADLLVAELLDRGASGAMVEIGGDLRVAGTSPSGPGWRIDVENPLAGADNARTLALDVIEIVDGGVATSSRLIRQWTKSDGTSAHHLLDPKEGRPANGDVVAATVVTATGAWSEAFAKVPLVCSLAIAIPLLESEDVAALVLLADGTTVTTRTWCDVAQQPAGAVAVTA